VVLVQDNTQDPTGECLTCNDLKSSLHRPFACMRYKLSDLKFFQPTWLLDHQSTYSWETTSRRATRAWVDAPPTLLHISHRLNNRHIEILVRKFAHTCQDVDHFGHPTQRECPDRNDCGSGCSYAPADVTTSYEAYALYIPQVTGSLLRMFVGSADDHASFVRTRRRWTTRQIY